MSMELYWFWLCMVPGIGIKTIDKLMRYFNTPRDVFDADRQQFERIQDIDNAKKLAILNSRDRYIVERDYHKLAERNIHFISYETSGFPRKLTHLPDMPKGIFYQGKLPKDDQLSIAIIGARNCTSYGRELAGDFAKQLAANDIQVISGLARGVDISAHRGALLGGGDTFGVLGCGVNVCYPREHIEVFESMKSAGGIISEYGMGVSPDAWRFPMRNRIISGLSDGIFIVEAGARSGALITAYMGLEQGKDIFALPGRAMDASSEGCNDLIKAGAKMVTEPGEILEEYHTKIKKNKKSKIRLDKFEKLVYSSLCLIPKNIDEVADDVKLDISQIIPVLLSLELKGYVKQAARNHYIINI